MPQEAKSFGNKRGAVYKDKDHPDAIRESNITAAKGMYNTVFNIITHREILF